MSDKSNKFDAPNANLERKGLAGTAPVANPFNVEVERGKEIAAASDRAKEMIADQTAIAESRMERQKEREDKYREYGIQREKSKLLEKQFSAPQPVPTDPKAREVMQREIEDGSVRNYEKNQQFARDQIDRQYKYNVDEILKLDREERLPQHEQARDHEHENER